MFEKVVDGIKFTADEKDIDMQISELITYYRKYVDAGLFGNSPVISDSEDATSYLLEKLNEEGMNFQIYDLASKHDTRFEDLINLMNKGLVVVKGFEEYTSFVQENYFNNNRVELYKDKIVDEAKYRLYGGINLRRDSYFNDLKTIFVFSDSEYTIFNNVAFDFCTYCFSLTDFNEEFKPVSNSKVKSLTQYYSQKRLGIIK